MEKLIKGDTTVVMVSHSIERIRTLSDSVLWLDAGSVRMFGKTDDVVNAYMSYMQERPVGSIR